MKQNILFLALIALVIGVMSCNDELNSDNSSVLDASKISKIKRGEPVVVKFNSISETNGVEWNVSPNTNVELQAAGNSATLQFASAGNYKVTAKSGSSSGSVNLNVQDSLYTPASNPSSLELLKNETIQCTLSKVDSMGNGGLAIKMVTGKPYNCLNNKLMFSQTYANKNAKVALTGVYKPSDSFCISGEQKATAYTSLYPMADGTTALEIVLEGKSYTGSIVKTGSKYTISWNYTSGVLISPLTLN